MNALFRDGATTSTELLGRDQVHWSFFVDTDGSYLEGNEASARAQASAGYREVGRFRGQYFREGRWLDEVLTELLREDWEVS